MTTKKLVLQKQEKCKFLDKTNEPQKCIYIDKKGWSDQTHEP